MRATFTSNNGLSESKVPFKIFPLLRYYNYKILTMYMPHPVTKYPPLEIFFTFSKIKLNIARGTTDVHAIESVLKLSFWLQSCPPGLVFNTIVGIVILPMA